MPTVTVYGPGGYDPDKPNGNIIEQYDEPDEPEPPTLESLDEALAILTAELLGGGPDV